MIKASISWNAKQIAKASENGSLSFDNPIQRGYVWSRVKQAKLVDSLIRSYPVPPFYTIKTEKDAPAVCKVGSKIYDCVDGKQRCEAIRSFRADEFALVGCKPFKNEDGTEVDLNGLKYSELSEYFRDLFDSYTLVVYFYMDITQKEIAEMMSRLNNGVAMSNVANARISACDLDSIVSLAGHRLFHTYLTPASIKAFHNEDIVIKTILQINGEYELSSQNVKDVYEFMEITDTMNTELNNIFDKCDSVFTAVSEESKKSVKTLAKKVNLVSILNLISSHLDMEDEKLAKFLVDFFNGVYVEEYYSYAESCKSGMNHASNVKARNSALHTALSKVK